MSCFGTSLFGIVSNFNLKVIDSTLPGTNRHQYSYRIDIALLTLFNFYQHKI